KAEDGIGGWSVTGVQTCALPILITVCALTGLAAAAGSAERTAPSVAGCPVPPATALPHAASPVRAQTVIIARTHRMATSLGRAEIGRDECRGRAGGAGGAGARHS